MVETNSCQSGRFLEVKTFQAFIVPMYFKFNDLKLMDISIILQIKLMYFNVPINSQTFYKSIQPYDNQKSKIRTYLYNFTIKERIKNTHRHLTPSMNIFINLVFTSFYECKLQPPSSQKTGFFCSFLKGSQGLYKRD